MTNESHHSHWSLFAEIGFSVGKVHVHSHFQPFVHFATDVGTQCITGKTGLFDNTILIQEVTGEGMPSFSEPPLTLKLYSCEKPF